MKKTLAIIVVLMAVGTYSYAGPISQQWIKTYGNSKDQINCIQQTRDGGYIAAGNRRYDTGLVIDLLTMKLDVNGNISWQRVYPYGTWINDAYTIQQVSDGSYILAGFNGSIGFGAGWILKLDGNGDILWQKAYEEITQFTSIQQTTDGGYVALGDWPPEVVITKLDSAGNCTWAKSYLFSIHEQGSHILQTNDGGYIITMHAWFTNDYVLCILKLDSSGDILWQKSYGNNFDADSIQQTSDEGYIVAGNYSVLKLNADGDIVWERYYTGSPFAIQQTMDGGYTAISSWGDILVLQLDNGGNIIWHKAYGGTGGSMGYYFGKTIDGGSIIAGKTNDGYDVTPLTLLKLDRNGEIPDCSFTHTIDAVAVDLNKKSQNINATVTSFLLTVIDTNAIPQDITVNTSAICYYEDPNDVDGDGVEFIPNGGMASGVYNGSFLAEGDNCSDMPNGPFLGTCTDGRVGSTCIAHAACGANGFCSMNQEDRYPPQGNSIGDACDCEGNFDCDSDIDGTDAATFKIDFGRNTFQRPCIAGNSCNGDFSCDGDVDGTDAALLKQDFGRSQFQNPCPACVSVGEWCVFP